MISRQNSLVSGAGALVAVALTLSACGGTSSTGASSPASSSSAVSSSAVSSSAVSSAAPSDAMSGMTTMSTPAASASASPSASMASGSAAASSTIGVVEDEYSIELDSATASRRSGKVTFKVKNAGQLKHEFVVIKTTKKADDLLKGKEADEKGNVGEIGNIDPGQSKNLTLKLAPGHYALICNLPGHYMPRGMPGMLADLTVT